MAGLPQGLQSHQHSADTKRQPIFTFGDYKPPERSKF